MSPTLVPTPREVQAARIVEKWDAWRVVFICPVPGVKDALKEAVKGLLISGFSEDHCGHALVAVTILDADALRWPHSVGSALERAAPALQSDRRYRATYQARRAALFLDGGDAA